MIESNGKHFREWIRLAPFVFRDKYECAVLAQARVFSVSRLYNKIGMLPDSDLKLIRKSFIKLYGKTK